MNLSGKQIILIVILVLAFLGGVLYFTDEAQLLKKLQIGKDGVTAEWTERENRAEEPTQQLPNEEAQNKQDKQKETAEQRVVDPQGTTSKPAVEPPLKKGKRARVIIGNMPEDFNGHSVREKISQVVVPVTSKSLVMEVPIETQTVYLEIIDKQGNLLGEKTQACCGQAIKILYDE